MPTSASSSDQKNEAQTAVLIVDDDGNTIMPVPVHTSNQEANYRFFTRLADGRSLLSCHAQNAVLIVDGDGEVAGKVEGVEFAKPEGIAIDGEGQILIVDRYRHCIHVLDQRLVHRRSMITDHQPIGRLNQPVGIAVSPKDGRIWVADNENHRVIALTKNGWHSATLGSGYGTAPGQLFCPCGVAIYDHPDHGELIVVSEWGGGRVQVFEAATGSVFAIFGGVPHAHHVVVDKEGMAYASEYSSRRIKRFSIDGNWRSGYEESAVSLVAGDDGLAMVVTPTRVVAEEDGKRKRKRGV